MINELVNNDNFWFLHVVTNDEANVHFWVSGTVKPSTLFSSNYEPDFDLY